MVVIYNNRGPSASPPSYPVFPLSQNVVNECCRKGLQANILLKVDLTVSPESFYLLLSSRELMQLVADNYLTQDVHETTRQNNILDLVISTEEEIIVDLKI